MKIKFKDGEENIPIIENAVQSETSVFKNQYILADKIFKTLKKDANARKYNNIISFGAPDKPCGVGRADANPKTVLPNDT